MSKKSVAIILSGLRVFENPDPKAEQYPTDSEVAAEIIWDAFMAGDIEGKSIADIGCGTGILGIGALIQNARRCIFVDIDANAIRTAQYNLRMVDGHIEEAMESAEFLNYGIEDFFTPVDTVLMNPPFGTRNKGADLQFLKRAFQISKCIYTLHKASTKDYIRKVIEQHGWKVTYEKEFDMPLKNTMAHHTRKIQRIKVVCFGCKPNP